MLYLKTRLKDLSHIFSKDEVIKILSNSRNRSVNYEHQLLLKGRMPSTYYTRKPISDELSLLLWNAIFYDRPEFRLDDIHNIKKVAAKVISKYDKLFPRGHGMKEVQFIQYVQAQSASSYLGIQDIKTSKAAIESMINTLEQHNKHDVVDKPWLTENLQIVSDHLVVNDDMRRGYDDVIIHAKRSSSSIPGHGKYRDYVIQHTLEDMIKDIELGNIPYVLYAGTRLDRRHKYRIICSTDARVRTFDYLLNNGSYALCEHNGLLSKYTTEGFDGRAMWEQMKIMSNRDGHYVLACIDYKGYDTQISQFEYAQIMYMLNKHRLHDPVILKMYRFFLEWLYQPKPVVTRGSDGLSVLVSLYTTLPSGLHGTHSFENLMGISMYKQLGKIGISTNGFWSNGDDQNIFIKDGHVDQFYEFINKYFRISWDKSLVGHRAAVWGKQWFMDDFSPVQELGTIRSLFEKEGGNVDIVEESKFEANYCKMLQILVALYRVGLNDIEIYIWIKRLCRDIGVRHDVIPKSLNNLSPIVSSRSQTLPAPKGLESVKYDMVTRELPNNLLEVPTMYDLVKSMYGNVALYTLELEEIEYHPENTKFKIRSGVDYSMQEFSNIPANIRRLMIQPSISKSELFIRDVLQGTKSYDGPVFGDYHFYDVFSLVRCIAMRNDQAWSMLSTRE